MKKSLLLLFSLLLWSIASCVTINIYFPAAAAEKAADQIIRDIQKNAPPQSWQHWRSTPLSWLNVLGISPAYAQPDLNLDSPEIRTLKASMQRRFPKLKQYLDSGWVGYANDGLVALRNRDRIPLRELASVEQLIAAENRDRTALYQAIARANGHPEWATEIQSTFARRWVANAESGWWVQDSSGGWQQK